MNWDVQDLGLLKKLWASGQSAGQIADRLGYSRNAVSAKLRRLGLTRGHKPATAKPKIVSIPKQRKTSLAACTQPSARVVSSRQLPKKLSKVRLYAMLAEAVRNTR
jgi:GcrA cell cycle regulator